MNKLGMHIHGIRPGIIEAVTLLQPHTVTIMDPKSEDIRAIRDASPGTFIVMRKYEDGRAWRDTDPFDWAEMNYALCGGLADGVIAWNEPFGHDDRGSCAPFDEWTYAFWSACRQIGSMEAVVLCMATGNWTGADDRYKITDDFPLTCSSARYFGPHEYSWPTLQAGAGWYALRFKAWIEDLKAIGRDDFSFIITEAGLTQAVIAGRPDHGYRSGGPEGVTEDSYISTIDWYNARLCEDWHVLGCCLYDWAGSHYGWGTFEQLGLEQRIYQIQAPEPPEPPEPPPNGGDNVIRVFGLDGNELEGEEALDRIAFHGITVYQPQNLREGEWYWAVVEMREAMHAGFIYTGLLEDGSVAAGQECAWAWTDDMGEADDILGDNHPTDWQQQADIGYLNGDGNMGPAYGQKGWFHAPYEPGPGRAWIRDPLRWAVFLGGMGMLDMTNHHTMFATWQLKQWVGDGEPPPPEPPEDGVLAEILSTVKAAKADTSEILHILGTEPPPPLPPEPPAEQPFLGQYFNNINLGDEPVFTRKDEKIDFRWGYGSPDPRINSDNFSVRWTGRRTFAGRTTFYVRADDGVRLYINNQLVIDQWHDQGPTTYSQTLPLTAGEWDIRLDYYERGGNSTIEFWWI